jgi:hypothetical protein
MMQDGKDSFEGSDRSCVVAFGCILHGWRYGLRFGLNHQCRRDKSERK